MNRVVTGLIGHLPPTPLPWSVDELCRRLAEQRSRPLRLHEVDVPALPFGLWFDDGTQDFILYRAGCTGYHRDHIILHELCHMLAGDNTVHPHSGRGTKENGFRSVIERAAESPFNDSQEEVAESFAARVLKFVGRTPPHPISRFEQRATMLFGIR
jgi:hypothetical protein